MGLTMTRGKHLNSEAVLALVRDMNAYTRFVAKPMREHGNVTGADNVVTWQTGYPFGVNHVARLSTIQPGRIHDRPTCWPAARPMRRMIVACDPMSNFGQRGPRAAGSDSVHRARSPRKQPTTRAATVAFTTATYGINTPGTVYRMDDVPIPLRPAFDSPHPSDFEVLSAIEMQVKQLQAASRA